MPGPYSYLLLLQQHLSHDVLSLDNEESFHLTKVLRARKGQPVVMTDGLGYLADAEIIEPSPKETIIKLKSDPVIQPQRNYSVHIAIAPPRHPDRLEWFVEKVTETGIDAISLMVCEHSEKWNVKIPRLTRIMTAALKQSQQAWLPKLYGPSPFPDVIRHAGEQEKWIGYCSGDPELLANQTVKGRSVIIAIGPEGDFSSKEIEQAIEAGFFPINLGPTRLRTETAGWVACQTIHIINQLQDYKLT
ncbi:MAG: RsmE family RNA methyltransferase [Bacteroidetes bacterium]|nr:RsmE family RNA methyltransferase [Bacteroidota bacterium]